MSKLDEIVTVNIDISAPAVDSANFDNLLILGAPPKVPKVGITLPALGVYTDLVEVTAAGYVSTGNDADPIGIAARIAFSQNPKPTHIFIAAQAQVEIENEDGEPETALASPVKTLEGISGTGWYVICAAGIDETEIEEIAQWTEAQNKQFAYTFLSKTDPVKDIYFRSQGWCGLVYDDDTPETVPEENEYLHVAAVAKCLSFPAGSETWAFKRLSAVNPSEISSTLRRELTDGHSNFFSQYAGRNVTMNGQMRGGEWIDVIRGRDWLQNDMQLRIVSLLFQEPKIPYTNRGIALVENQMIASLKTATTRGIVAENEYNEDGELVPGFVTTVPNSQSLTATQRASRVLTGCKFSARIAGAIHVVRIDGSLTYEGSVANG
ncbi:MAG: DUF3383 domain-containing protein [Clostridiales bacterium]|jgi:hypothetical protein|nr:DUF3383 domain-containing protein [Clostridiales bacterium]